MSFRLIRGKTVDEVAEAFRSRTSEEGSVDRLSSTRFDCSMTPSPTLREGGTLQKGTFTMHQKPSADYGDTYYLVVRCEKKWAGDEHTPQRYALVAVVEHSAQINLYNTIRERAMARLRVRPQHELKRIEGMIPKECKRLAEVDFPIAVVSKHSAMGKILTW